MSSKKLNHNTKVKEINTNTPEFKPEIESIDPGFWPGFFFGFFTVFIFMTILILSAYNIETIAKDYKDIFCFNLKK